MTGPAGAADGPAFDELAAVLAFELDRPLAGLGPDAGLVEVFPDELDRYRLHLVLDRWVPGFELPAQLDPADARLADVHHYLLGALAHRERPRR